MNLEDLTLLKKKWKEFVNSGFQADDEWNENSLDSLLEAAEATKGRYGEIWWEWMQTNHPELLKYSKNSTHYLILHHEINLRAEVEYRELFTRYMIEQKTGTYSEQSEKASPK